MLMLIRHKNIHMSANKIVKLNNLIAESYGCGHLIDIYEKNMTVQENINVDFNIYVYKTLIVAELYLFSLSGSIINHASTYITQVQNSPVEIYLSNFEVLRVTILEASP